MDLSKYSIFKFNISPISKDKNGRDEYKLECIKKIDGDLLRKTITKKQKFMKIDNVSVEINPNLNMKLFNNIKKALTYKYNNISKLNYVTPIQTLQEHYISMLSFKVFGIPYLKEPFSNIKKLNEMIENEIDNMIYRFLDVESYNNKKSLNEIINLLKEENVIINFQCIIKPPPELNKYNINESIWNMNVLVD